MNHTTKLTSIEDINNSIQTGQIPKVKLGDTINGKYVIVDSIGIFREVEAGKSYFIFTETVRNNSTKETFVEKYVSTEQQGFGPHIKHLEVLSVESSPIDLTVTTPTPAKVSDVAKGEFVRFAARDNAPVWVKGHYDRASKTYSFSKADDMNREIFRKGTAVCFIGFSY